MPFPLGGYAAAGGCSIRALSGHCNPSGTSASPGGPPKVLLVRLYRPNIGFVSQDEGGSIFLGVFRLHNSQGLADLWGASYAPRVKTAYLEEVG
jgi:hypothetical protein